MVVHWPEGIDDAGAVRSHYTHVTDVGATVLDLAGIPMPDTIDGIAQQPFDGATFADSFKDASAPERHTQQYYEILGNRGMYKDGWLLAQRLQRIPWDLDPEKLRTFGPGFNPDDEPIQLYYLPDDFTQLNGHRGRPSRQGEGAQRAFLEGGRGKQRSAAARRADVVLRHGAALPEESKFVFRGDIQNIPSGMIPRIYNHSYTISADLVIPEDGAEGVIVAEADHLGGFSLFVQDGKLKHIYSMLGVLEYTQAAETAATDGRSQRRARLHCRRAEAGDRRRGDAARQRRAGRERADGAHRARPLLGLRRHGHRSRQRSVVDRSYADKAPFAFTGKIKQVVFDVAPHLSDEDARTLYEHAAQALATHAASD